MLSYVAVHTGRGEKLQQAVWLVSSNIEIKGRRRRISSIKQRKGTYGSSLINNYDLITQGSWVKRIEVDSGT